MYAAAAYVSDLSGASTLPKTKKESWRKKRLEGKMRELSREFEFANILLKKRDFKKKHKDRLERKYNIQRKRLNIAREEMKERIKAVGAKIKRFNSRSNQCQQKQCEIPNSVEAPTF